MYCDFPAVPFACDEFGAATCMLTPALVSTTSLQATTESGALLGNIDSTSHMAHDRVWIYNGMSDTVVNPGNASYNTRFVTRYALVSICEEN